MTVELLAGDCLEVLPTLAESSVDSCVTDPPYHLTSIVKRFANAKAESEVYAATSNSGYMSRGFMGKQWDGGDIAFRLDVWREVYRVLKPGAHLLAFGGTRTYHRMACAIEDAGFEIRDCIMWVYGSGFPKSHDVSKGIDRAAGVERVVIGSKLDKPGYHLHSHDGGEAFGHGLSSSTYETRLKSSQITEAATDAACRWQGWGTALKPAVEPIVLARKPLSEDTVAANVLRWGTGAVNVDGCRVGEREEIRITWAKRTSNCYGVIDVPGGKELPPGRWPSNLIHDGSEEVVAGFPEADGAVSNGRKGVCGVAWGKGLGSVGQEPGYNDSGSPPVFSTPPRRIATIVLAQSILP